MINLYGAFMNYAKIYKNIVDKRKLSPYTDGYSEKHHILPRSLGGSKRKANMVQLSAKEHYICHLLLTRMYASGTEEHFKMVTAWNCMQAKPKENQRHSMPKGSLYAKLKQEYSDYRRKEMLSDKNHSLNTMWIYNPTTLETKKIPSDQTIPDGWYKGRRYININRTNITETERQQLIDEYNYNVRKFYKWYGMYLTQGFTYMCSVTGWNKAKGTFKQYINKYLNDEDISEIKKNSIKEKRNKLILRAQWYYDMLISCNNDFNVFVERTEYTGTKHALRQYISRYLNKRISYVKNKHK